MRHRVAVIRGEGVGPEVVEAAIRVIEATGVDVEWIPAAVGHEGEFKHGDPLPSESLRLILACGVVLKGPLLIEKMGRKVVVNHEDDSQRIYSNVNTALRLEAGAFVNVRPVRAFAGVAASAPRLDIVIIRELTEDIYSGYEHAIGDDAAEAVKITTRRASERVARFAFDYAIRHNRKQLSVIHKANVLQLTDGLFLRTISDVARDYRQIAFEDSMVDSCAYNLVVTPERWDVLLTSNQYGDIISDLCAGLVGSFGLVPGAVYGESVAIFEAAHGAAPDIAGLGVVNPAALVLSGALMLEHLGESDAAKRIRDAVTTVISAGRVLTPDLGGSAKTSAMTNVIIDHL